MAGVSVRITGIAVMTVAICLLQEFPAAAELPQAVDLATMPPSPNGSEGEFHYDGRNRTIYIGDFNQEQLLGTPAQVSISRASDIVGRPLQQIISRNRGGVSSEARGSLAAGLPLRTFVMTSGFGMRQHPIWGEWREHRGVDLAAAAGSPVTTTLDGIVTAAGWLGSYGQFVSINSGRGVETRYAHMSGLNVTSGQRVRSGDVIGYVGSTGRSTGPHLHYEVRVDGRAVNPMSRRRARQPLP